MQFCRINCPSQLTLKYFHLTVRYMTSSIQLCRIILPLLHACNLHDSLDRGVTHRNVSAYRACQRRHAHCTRRILELCACKEYNVWALAEQVSDGPRAAQEFVYFYD